MQIGHAFQIDELKDCDWLFVYDEDKCDVFPVREKYKKVTTSLKIPIEFLEMVDNALRDMANELIDAMRKDSADLADLTSRES